MNHTLILPFEFVVKLDSAFQNRAVSSKWNEIGVSSVEDFINKIIKKMNLTYPKLFINKYRLESKDQIKQYIENTGASSIFAGYLESGEGYVDGLFFYIPPSLDSGNDFLTRQVVPTLIGIYNGISSTSDDLHFNNRPVFIVNINETRRSEQKFVKISFLCCELLGFKYMDLFDRNYHDIISNNYGESDFCLESFNLNEFNKLFLKDGENNLFSLNKELKIITLKSDSFRDSTNSSAEVYRYWLKVLPAIYMAVNEKYKINIDAFDDLLNTNLFNPIRSYIKKLS